MNNTIKQFQRIVWEHYKNNKRTLPWRETKDSYEILISEVMLQQTQVGRVLGKYALWLRLFPIVSSLASASQSEVIKAWSGLGYNRRALALHKSAQIIVEKYDGAIPLDIEVLKSLPGLGDYTAKAVYTFSTNKPSIFIETNIRSAILHHFFRGETSVKDTDLIPFIKDSVDPSNPREWYYALMDYGSWLKRTFSNPSKRSKTYSNQSKFEGSKRQVRGRILKDLSEKEYITIDEILSFAQKSKVEVDSIITELVKEGFITYSNGSITLKH